MIFSIRCHCGRILAKEVKFGYSSAAILRAAGWQNRKGHYVCPDCTPSGATLQDYSDLLGWD